MKTGPRYPSVLPAAESLRFSKLPACSSIRKPCGRAEPRLAACRFVQMPLVKVTAVPGSVLRMARELAETSIGPATRRDVAVIESPSGGGPWQARVVATRPVWRGDSDGIGAARLAQDRTGATQL